MVISSNFNISDTVRLDRLSLQTVYTQRRSEPGHEKMCLMSYANNKGAVQPAHPRSLISANYSRFYSRNFKTLASFCGCTGRFVSGLVGNSRRHVLSCRGSSLIRDYHKNKKNSDTRTFAEITLKFEQSYFTTE